jgi:hypothetical protein
VPNQIQVLVGATGNIEFTRVLRDMRWGRMWTNRLPRPYPGEPWGLDNGAYGAWKNGTPWNGDTFLHMVDRCQGLHKPYVSVLPDIVGGGIWRFRMGRRLRMYDRPSPAATLSRDSSWEELMC